MPAISPKRQGLYRERSFRSLPLALREKYFTREQGGWRVAAHLHERVQWRVVNLLVLDEVNRQLPAPVIFCRNVFIYFSGAAISRTVASFAEGMPAGGHLFVGVSESLLKYSTAFDLREIGRAFVYVKH